MEVYNESVYDLLVPPSEGHAKLQLHKRGKEVIVPVSYQICLQLSFFLLFFIQAEDFVLYVGWCHCAVCVGLEASLCS